MTESESAEFGVGVVATILSNTLKEIDRAGTITEICMNVRRIGTETFFRAEARWTDEAGKNHFIQSKAFPLSNPMCGTMFTDALPELVGGVHHARAVVKDFTPKDNGN